MIEHPVQLRPIPTATGGLLLIDAGAAGRFEGADLGRGILIIGLRDAGVAEQHGCRSKLLPLVAIWQQDFAQRKSLVLRLPRFRRVDERFESAGGGITTPFGPSATRRIWLHGGPPIRTPPAHPP